MDKRCYYRQGEIIIRKASDKQTNVGGEWRVNGVIREGEATGHTHTLSPEAKLYVRDDGSMYFKVEDKPAVLTHQEHAPITFPKGEYEVVIQREYDEVQHRYIAD